MLANRTLRTAWIAVAGALAVTFFAPVASARCVRDIAESGAISVRCTDGVRGQLASDNLPPPSANSAYRGHDASRTSRSDYAGPTVTPSPYAYRAGDASGRPSDSAAGALSRARTPGSGDRPLY
jgi:hypothetical protein